MILFWLYFTVGESVTLCQENRGGKIEYRPRFKLAADAGGPLRGRHEDVHGAFRVRQGNRI